MIDDDDISCQVPTTAPPKSSVNVFYCQTLISLAKLSSLVAKKLSSVEAFRRGPETLANTVSELEEQLTAVKSSAEPILKLGAPPDHSRLPHSMSVQQVVYVQYAYFSTLFDIHTALTCPWTQNILGRTKLPKLRAQVERSTQVVALSCREAILATKHIHIDASTPLL